MSGSLRIDHAVMASVTDLGRTRGPAVGLPVNGALDQYSARVANIIVANAQDAPLIEITASDLEFTPAADILLAVTGAPMTLSVDGIVQRMWQPVSVQAGQVVTVESMTAGLRTYVAVHGGFDVPMLLGSCCPDPVVEFGTTLRTGDELTLRRSIEPVINPRFDLTLFNLDVLIPFFGGTVTIDVTDGPDVEQFAGTVDRLFQDPFLATEKSNHIGLRFSGALPERRCSGEVISRGVPVGAVEVPPGDELLVLHRGRGVTAGYPVLAVVTPIALDALAQVRPGQQVRFRHSDVERAGENARTWHMHLERLRGRVETVFSCLGYERLLQTSGSTTTPTG
jgi:biotin-dependent carboxylase-like uncharacterized protein